MNKRGILGLIVVVSILLVVGFFWFVSQLDTDEALEKDVVNDTKDERCVPASCCHATECAWESEAQGCEAAFCTLSCEPGTMDCGAGHCEIVDGECGVVWNE